MNTIQGKPVDRVPVVAVLVSYGARFIGKSMRTLYSDVTSYVESQMAVQEAFGLDAVLSSFEYSAISEAFGGTVAWFENQTPNMKKPAFTSADDALAAPLPNPYSSGRLPVILEATGRLGEHYKNKVPVFAAVPSPSALCILMLGLEKWLETLLFDEPVADILLKKSEDFFLSWTDALLEQGTTALIMTEPLTSAEIVTRELFKTRILLKLHTVLAKVKGPVVFHHSGSRLNHVLDLIPGLPQVAGVAVSSKDQLSHARQLIGPDMLLLGNIDNLSFPNASAAEIKEISMSRLRESAPSGHYILTNSGADIPVTTPPENIRAMLDASIEYANEVQK
jgi:uroporphyrinogen decarboxylase